MTMTASIGQEYALQPGPGDGVRCPNCGHNGLAPFHEIERIPVSSCRLVETKAEALDHPRGAIQLAFCLACGFITNAKFDPFIVDYSSSYEETQSFSPRFRSFLDDVVQHLIQNFDLREKLIVEIGCGRGDFLTHLCDTAEARGIGIDPSYGAGRVDVSTSPRVSFIKEFYSEAHVHLPANLICCRHTLEHIHPTLAFLRRIRRAANARSDTALFFEVPDSLRIFQDVAFWDIHYEHCSYFSAPSLRQVFEAADFSVLNVRLGYGDQYLLIDAVPSACKQPSTVGSAEIERIAGLVDAFRNRYLEKTAETSTRLGDIRSKGLKAVLWGSGSKAVSYLTVLGVEDQFEYVVDINPFRQGLYLAGPGQQVVAPEFLIRYQPDVIIAMNAIYLEEITASVRDMGLTAKVIAA